MHRLISTLLVLSLLFVTIPSLSVSEASSDFAVTGGVLTAYIGSASELTIPENVNGEKVVRIDSYAFSGSTVQELTLPSGLESIGIGAFFGCTDLHIVHFPDTLTSVEEFAFYGSGLTEASLPDSLQSIGSSAFGECYDLVSVTMPTGALSITDDAFWNCPAVLKVQEGSDAYSFAVRMNASFQLNGGSVIDVSAVQTEPMPDQKADVIDSEFQLNTDSVIDVSAAQTEPMPEQKVESIDPKFLPGTTSVSITSGQKPTAYAYPSTKGYKMNTFKTSNELQVYGRIDDWVLVHAKTSKGKEFIGYVNATKLKGLDISTIPELELCNIYAGICRDTSLYLSPDINGDKMLKSLPNGTEVKYLATTGDWAYIETKVSKKNARGFVPRKDVLPKIGEKINIVQAIASSTVSPTADSVFNASQMLDGDIGTSWQFKTTSGLSNTYAMFGFSSPVSLDRMVINNGFWRVTKGYDQYQRNGVITEMEISFLYAGEREYRDTMRIILPETKDWKKREDGLYINLNGHDQVMGVKIVPCKVRKGKRFKNDVAISEIAFYSK